MNKLLLILLSISCATFAMQNKSEMEWLPLVEPSGVVYWLIIRGHPDKRCRLRKPFRQSLLHRSARYHPCNGVYENGGWYADVTFHQDESLIRLSESSQ